jgi:uncharacterized membrane protein YfcA
MIVFVFGLLGCVITGFAAWWFMSNLYKPCFPKAMGLLMLIVASQFICGAVTASERWKSNLVRVGHAEWYLNENFDRKWRLITPKTRETKEGTNEDAAE